MATQPMMPAQGQAAPTRSVADDLPVIQKIENDIQRQIPASARSNVERLVTAGMRVMFDPRTHGLVLKQLQVADHSDGVAQGVAGLMSILEKQSKGPFPIPAVVPAAMLLMCQALDFMGKAGIVNITPQFVAQTATHLLAYLGQKLGVTAQSIAHAKQATGGVKLSGQPQPGAGGAPVPARGPGAAPPPAGGLLQRAKGGV